MAKIPNDYELDFLKTCSKEELEPLVGAILGTDDEGNIDRSGRFTSVLDVSPAFVKFYPDHTKYVDAIIEELQKYGANTFATIMRGGMGVPYHEVLCDVAKKLKVGFDKAQRTQEIEEALVAKVLGEAWGKLSEEQRCEALKEAGEVIDGNLEGLNAANVAAILRAGGARACGLATIVMSAVSMTILGHGLRVGAGFAFTRALAVLTGPIGWTLVGLWTAVDFASPAYRVTVPACIYIAALRKKKDHDKRVSI